MLRTTLATVDEADYRGLSAAGGRRVTLVAALFLPPRMKPTIAAYPRPEVAA